MMNRLVLISVTILMSLCMSCSNNPKPKEGNQYVKIDKGLMLPVPNIKDSTKFDFTKVKVTFESDGVYMRTAELMRNAMMSVEFKTPQYKTTFGSKESNTRIGLEFKDEEQGWNIYYAPYSDFKKYTPYWTWDDVEGIRFVYHPESYHSVFLSMNDFETIDEYFEADRKLGFKYEVTIYRDWENMELANDPDFDSVFKLFKAHMQN